MITVSGANLVLGLFANLVTPPGTYWLALSQTEITSTMTGVDIQEPIGLGGYARVPIANDESNWELVSTTLWNRNTITFPVATEDWGVIRFWALCTSESEGDIVVADELVEPVAVVSEDEITIEPGSIDIDIGVDTWSM